ncbi:hypothetical protein D3880_10575 [Pseudomonas cavernae]|uniref:MmgE/PrpD C-terminal domain-containing protein n=2 Tax=Pseudomonas cavernae TaxID=2320867 RepID=A0A385Z168_9PSED|nr:hypothetical protein D3880_10575 [Pseudomonas cavernae]
MVTCGKHPLRAEDIESIDIELSHAVYHHGWWELERPITPIAAQMNIAYAIAVAIIDGEAMVRQFAPQRIDSDDVWDLIPRIRAHHQPEFDKAGSKGRGMTRLRVRLSVLSITSCVVWGRLTMSASGPGCVKTHPPF